MKPILISSVLGVKGLTNGQADVDLSFLLHRLRFDDRICSLDGMATSAL